MLRALALLSSFAVVACQSSPPAPSLPDGQGRGVLTADTVPPPGGRTWERPTWQVGDRFVLQLGDRQRGQASVTAILADAYVIDNGGVQTRRGLDLGHLGEFAPNGQPLHVLTPADTRYHWPLWVGKHWTCEFVDRALGGRAMTMVADYTVEALDTVVVPAGTFEALRIVRRVQWTDAGEPLPSRAQVVWYGPAVGTEVRQLVGDTLVELVERPRAERRDG